MGPFPNQGAKWEPRSCWERSGKLEAMDEAIVILVFAAFVALAVMGSVLAAQQAAKRRDALEALAGRLGWHFNAERDPSHDERFRQFAIFRKGHGRNAYNTLEGQTTVAGRPFHCRAGDFMYKVTRSNGKSSSTRTYRFSYLIVRPPFWVRADLRIRPERIMDKLAGAVGFDDIDFESEEFSRRYFVKSSDKRFAYDVIHPRMMEFLLASSPVMIELDEGYCCLSDGRVIWEPQAFEQNLAWLNRFFEHWPEYLLETLEGEKPT